MFWTEDYFSPKTAAGFNGGQPQHRGDGGAGGNRTSIGATLKNMFMGSLTSRRNQGGPGGGPSWPIPMTPGPMGSVFMWPMREDGDEGGCLKKSQSTPSLYSMITSPLPSRATQDLPTYPEVDDDDWRLITKEWKNFWKKTFFWWKSKLVLRKVEKKKKKLLSSFTILTVFSPCITTIF